MCYSGKCRYENYYGDCDRYSRINGELVPWPKDAQGYTIIPEDAACVLADKAIDECINNADSNK